MFTQIVYLCRHMGLIGFEHLGIEGQKIEANGSFTKSKKLEALTCFQKELEKLGSDDERLNMTERDAKGMRHKDGGQAPPVIPTQSAVDDGYGVVTVVQTTCVNGGLRIL